MHQLLDLVCEDLIKPGVAMANANSGNSTSKINEFSTCIIVQILAIAPNCKKWFLIVGLVEWEHVLLV